MAERVQKWKTGICQIEGQKKKKKTTHTGLPRLTRHQKLQPTANKHQVFLRGLGQAKRGSQKIPTSYTSQFDSWRISLDWR